MINTICTNIFKKLLYKPPAIYNTTKKENPLIVVKNEHFFYAACQELQLQTCHECNIIHKYWFFHGNMLL